MTSDVDVVRTDPAIAARPADVHILLADAVDANDLDAFLQLWHPDAVLIVAPGRLVTGSAAIRRSIERFFNGKKTLQEFDLSVFERKVIEVGDLARLESTWGFFFVTDEGYAVSSSGKTADIVRRQEDGSWRLVFADWWGR